MFYLDFSSVILYNFYTFTQNIHTMKKHIFTLIAFVLAAVFIWIILKDFNFSDLQKGLQKANYLYIIIAFLLTVISYWIRAMRWHILFEPMKIKISNESAFNSIAIAYFFNLGIPRSGEVIRATSLYKMEKVAVEKSVATIVLERIIDLLCLMFFIILNLTFNYDLFLSFLKMGNYSQKINWFSAQNITFLSGLIVVFLLIFAFRNKIFQHKLFSKSKLFLKGFIEGLHSILKLKKRAMFLFFTIALWSCYFFMTYFVVLAFQETNQLGFSYALFLLVAGSLGLLFPAAGGLGYPIAMAFAFEAIYIFLGKDAAEGKQIGNFYGIVSYFFQIIAMILLGTIAMIRMSRKLSKS